MNFSQKFELRQDWFWLVLCACPHFPGFARGEAGRLVSQGGKNEMWNTARLFQLRQSQKPHQARHMMCCKTIWRLTWSSLACETLKTITLWQGRFGDCLQPGNQSLCADMEVLSVLCSLIGLLGKYLSCTSARRHFERSGFIGNSRGKVADLIDWMTRVPDSSGTYQSDKYRLTFFLGGGFLWAILKILNLSVTSSLSTFDLPLGVLLPHCLNVNVFSCQLATNLYPVKV